MTKENYIKVDVIALDDKHSSLIELLKSHCHKSSELVRNKKIYISINQSKKEFTLDVTDLENVGISFDGYVKGMIKSFVAVGIDVYIKESK